MRIQPEVREQMFKLIEQWQQSSLTQNVFCAQQSIRYHVFHYWYKRYREQHADHPGNAASFVKLHIGKPASASAVEIYFPCLLYTSDAADDLLCVDLGGRRIIKK